FGDILEVVLHAVREAVGHHACGMNAGVDADHVHQVGRAHRPAELFHHLVDGLEVGAVAHQHAEAGEVREQDAVNEEARAVVDDDRVLSHFLRVGNQGGDGFVGGLLTTDDFHQRHHVHRVEEVHAGKVFRLLQRSSEIGNGNGRGVGGQHGAVLQLGFGFGQYGLLDLRVFDNRFNHYVDILEVTVVQGRADGREHLAHLRAVDLLALQLLGEQLAGFAHAQVQRRVGDVLHDDRRALGGRLVGDAATHDAGTEDGGQVDVPCAFLDVVAIGFFHRLVGEEQANQRSRLRGLGNLGKTFRFGSVGIVTLHAAVLLHDVDRGNRGRVVLASLLHDEGGRGLERHHVFQRRQFQRLELFSALLAVVEFAGEAFLHQGKGGVANLVGRHDGVNHAIFQCLVGAVLATGGDPLNRVVDTDHARHAHGATEAREQAQLHFRQAHLGAVGHDAVIARQGHFQAAAEGDAVDGADGRHVEVFNRVEHLVRLQAPAGDFVFRQLEHVGEFGDVGADDKYALAGGDDQALDVAVALDGVNCRLQILNRFA